MSGTAVERSVTAERSLLGARLGRRARAQCGPSGVRGALDGQAGRLAAGASARVQLPVLAPRRARQRAQLPAPRPSWPQCTPACPRAADEILCAATRKITRPCPADRVELGVRGSGTRRYRRRIPRAAPGHLCPPGVHNRTAHDSDLSYDASRSPPPSTGTHCLAGRARERKSA